MANVSIKFNGKKFLLSCEDGQEEHLEELLIQINKKFNNLKNDLGNLGENKLLLITAVKVMDEYYETKKKVEQKKEELKNLSYKFKELKSLIYEYKDRKEHEIKELNENHFKLKNEIEIGNFREDLYHRLNVFEINIEPLSQRISDIPLLIKYFSQKIADNYNLKELDIDEDNSYLLNHSWPGNVRELRNLIERIAILQPDTKDKVSNIIKESLKSENLSDKITENSLSVPLKEAREKFEKEYLSIQLKKFNGNISKTANFVGMERSALHRKLKGLGIKEFN